MRSAPDAPGAGPRARGRDALTELHAYVLILDGELRRADDSQTELSRRRAEIAAQLELLSRLIVALRAHADPSGRYL